MSIRKEHWGAMPDGTGVGLYTMTNNEFETSIATYGGVITRLVVPDGTGQSDDVVLGYGSLDSYLDDCCFFGCIVGRVANRINNAHFELDGVGYDLDRNHGKHTLHGGSGGFHTRVWQAETQETDAGPQLTLTYISKDGEQGFPGTVKTTVTYILQDTGLRMEFRAQSDAPTPITLTNHTYFNLAGYGAGDCLDHVVTIPAGRFLVTDGEQIPTGELASVESTPFDFTTPAPIGEKINDDCEPLRIGQGYDHFFVLDDESPEVRLAARILEPTTGRKLEVHTDQPGVQFYSGNHMPPSVAGKNGATYGFRGGFCIEPQGYPDAPNRPEFPSITVGPDKEFTMTIIYHFPVK